MPKGVGYGIPALQGGFDNMCIPMGPQTIRYGPYKTGASPGAGGSHIGSGMQPSGTMHPKGFTVNYGPGRKRVSQMQPI